MRRPNSAGLTRTVFALSVLALGACGAKQAPDRAAAAPSGPPPAPTIDQLKGATVAGVFEQAVTLADGRYDGPATTEGGASHPTLTLWEPTVIQGNVDGAPGDEAVAMLSSNSGGSGEFVYVAVFSNRDGRLENIGTAEVGDRTKLQGLWLQGGKLVMDVVEVGPQDPACCPTQLARKSYAFEAGALKQVSSEVLGTLTLRTLSANEWQLVSIDGKPLAADTKAPVIHFERDGIRGFAGCNRFSAPAKESAPGVIEIGPAAATRMACPGPEMDLERDFLAGLGKVRGYTFLAGRLALTWTGKDGNGQLLFAK